MMVWDARQRAILRNLDRLTQAERRRWMRQERADALGTVRAAKAAGLPMRAVIIAGVKYELGEPAQPASAPNRELTEWDIELGKSAPPQIRQ